MFSLYFSVYFLFKYLNQSEDNILNWKITSPFGSLIKENKG